MELSEICVYQRPKGIDDADKRRFRYRIGQLSSGPSKRRAIRHLIETEAFHRSGQRSLRIHCCAPHSVEAAALFLAGVDESERLHERGISRVGNTTSEHNVQGNAQTARVLDLNPVGIVDGGAVATPHLLANL